MKITYEFSTKKDLDYLHQETLDLLKNVGVVFSSDKALEIFKNHGVRTDGNIVFFSEENLNQALKTVPRQFEWEGRNSSLTIGDGHSYSMPSYGPIYVSKAGKIELATPEDYVNFHKLHETSDVIDGANANVLEPTQIESSVRARYQMATTLLYSTKPIIGLTSGIQNSIMSINMTRDFYGRTEGSFIVGLINSAAPMHFSTDMVEAIITYAQEKQPVIITGGGMSGMTSPPSMASTILTSNTAILAGIILSQLVNPGTPVIYGLPSSGVDLRYSSPTCGSAEASLFALINKDIGRYYEIPVRAGGLLTDAKVNDYQSGYESLLMSISTYMSNVDFVLHACGILDTYNTLGYEKYILDEELIKITQRFLRGFEFTEELFCKKDIIRKGPTGNFLGRTSKMYLNDYFLPEFVNRESTQNWMKNGEKTIDEMALEKCEMRIKEYQLEELFDVQKKIITENIPEPFLLETIE